MNTLKYLLFVLSFIVFLNSHQFNALAASPQDLYEENDDNYYETTDDEEGDNSDLYE